MKKKRLMSLLLSIIFIVTLLPTIYVSASQINIMPDVQLGWSNSMLLKGDGTLWGWGANWSGKLGIGNTSNQNCPIKILDNVISFSASTGGSNGAAIKSDGSLWTWGDNGYGQLGNGTYKDSKIPIKIMDDVVAVSLGEEHGAAIKSDRSLWAWGYNGYGQLGDGTTEDSTTPIKIMDDVKMVSLGYNHSAAVKLDGSLYTWGSNQDGGLGNGQNSNSDLIDSIIGDEIVTHNMYLPQKIMDDVKMVSLGRWYGAAIKNDGTLWTWGDNDCGQLGDGTYEKTDYPIKIMENAKTVVLGAFYSAVIKNDNSLWLWGSNYAKTMSFTGGNDYYQLTPIKVMDNVFDASFNEHCAVIKKDGSLWMWGCNDYGQLGDETYEDAYVPFKLMGNVILPPQPQEITVLLDGQKVEFDQPPVMIDDRVMVPIRAVAEKMGDIVKWSEKDNSALIIHPDRMVVFKNNHKSVVIAKEPEFDKWEHYDLDVPAQIVGSRTLTPVRAIGECLGAKVEWDGETQTVKISSNKNINKTITDEKITKFNVYYSLTLKDNLFAEFSPEIKDFYESRNDWADAFIIWWDDWFLGVDNLISGEKNNVYMIKNCLAELFSDLPNNKEINMSTEIEITNWLSSGLSYLSYVDFTKVDKVVNISPHTANALSKFGNALDKAGLKLELTGVAFESLCKMLSDYTIGITYIDLIRETLKESSINDDVFYEALDNLEKEYTNKIVNALADGAKNGVVAIGSFVIGEVTGGAFTLASFSKDTLNAIVGNDDKADAVKNLHCIYWFNEYIDKAELSIKTDAYTKPKKIDDYMRIFNFQKIIKKKLYQSMDMLKNSKDEYTVNRIQEQLNKINNMSYIVWK